MSDHFQISRYGYSASIRLGAQSIVSVFGMPTRPAYEAGSSSADVRDEDEESRRGD